MLMSLVTCLMIFLGIRMFYSDFATSLLQGRASQKGRRLSHLVNIFSGIDSARDKRLDWSRNLAFHIEHEYNNLASIPRDRPRDLSFPHSHSRFNLLGPIGPNCTFLESYGSGDEEKRVCGLQKIPKNESCIVVSIGSNNEWLFEESIFKSTSCITHVFDCTVASNVEPPSYTRGRVFLHKVCIGDGDFVSKESRHYLTWQSLLAHANISTTPSFVKMDIEGWEYSVLRNIIDSGKHIPDQIGFEMHFSTYPMHNLHWTRRFKSPSELAIFMDFLFRFGNYYLVDRHDNHFCSQCSELLIARFPDKSRI